jgi:predicted porin
MKKLVLATLLAAATGLASAQTIYGVIDMGLTTGTNAEGTTKRATGLTSPLSTSRLGFKGTEDLGGGTKANYLLEAEILADTGSQSTASPSTTPLFHRGAWVQLEQAGLGAVKAGRINRHDYNMAVKYDAFGGNNLGGWLAANSGTVALGVFERIDNGIEIQSASIGGVQLTAQIGFGEVAGANQSGRTVAYGAEYTVGKLSTSLNYSEKNATTAGYATTKYTSAYAMYDLTVAKVHAGYATTKTDGTSAKPSGYFVGTVVPVTSKVNAIAQYNAFDSDAGQKPTVYALGATYAFSKRTTGYVLGAKSNQDNGSQQNIVNTSKLNGFDSPAAGLNQTVASVGIRHTF